jgi:hypothetical protein
MAWQGEIWDCVQLEFVLLCTVQWQYGGTPYFHGGISPADWLQGFLNMQHWVLLSRMICST